jgi:hypothetical protein
VPIDFRHCVDDLMHFTETEKHIPKYPLAHLIALFVHGLFRSGLDHKFTEAVCAEMSEQLYARLYEGQPALVPENWR